jgi:CubicO group peptidase (beta-lactamase class C family)
MGPRGWPRVPAVADANPLAAMHADGLHQKSLHGERGYGHSGSIPGYRAFLAHLPERNLTIAVLSNSDKEQELAAVIDALLAVALEPSGPDSSGEATQR